MLVPALQEFLERNRVPYRTVPHPVAYTAQETAAATHTPGREVAKVVVVKLDGRIAMAVIPASHRLDVEALRAAAGAGAAALAREEEFAPRFAGCEPGAEPPFGNLWNVPVWMSEALRAGGEIAFNGGTHAEVVRMPLGDFVRLSGAQVAPISHP